MNDMITSAAGEDGAQVTIEKAIKGTRYTGRGHHNNCELYPVFRGYGKRSSFSHMPNRAHCVPHRGESDEHRNMKIAWFEHLEDRLSDCRVCRVFVRKNPHLDCSLTPPVDLEQGHNAKIMWKCAKCQLLHQYDLLKDAISIVCEAWQFGRSCRPDITIQGEDEQPLVFIEFKKTNLSQNVRRIADDNGVHLFVVDVLDGKNVQTGLNNPQFRWYDSTDLDKQSIDFLRRGEAFNNQLGGSRSHFETSYDDAGNIIMTTFNFSEHDDSLLDRIPQPRQGHYLWASWSNLCCKSQQFGRMVLTSYTISV